MKARQQRGLSRRLERKVVNFNCGTLLLKEEGNNYNFAKEPVDCLHNSTIENQNISNRSSYKERKGNALASGADEGRDKLRKASGSCK